MKYQSTGLLLQCTTISATGICGKPLTKGNRVIIPTQPEVAVHSRPKQRKVDLFRTMSRLMPGKCVLVVKVFLTISARQPCFLTARVSQRRLILLMHFVLSYVNWKQRPSANAW